ncbi:GTPase-associated protein 1-related protein [Streptomyces sp. NBC_01267]|uniref:GTPase-associated protein 1-related protein n=1 Tax=Streptomyces sp. NBC_01267 TaxID=2903805 RepID=UPI002E31D05A|nr:GTPase-associated protein 1-related protein [Streptomyces sp. NBC_01267]
MSLAQLHYTSAPPGPDGSGFRFTAVTPGLPRSVLREAEQLIGYEPPRDAPPRPDGTELAAFPEAFSHSSLADGSRLLTRTVYTGSDYSGRWGNFHAHGVHLPVGAELPGGMLPIAAWRSPQWATATPVGAVAEPLEVRPVPGGFSRDALAGFAASRVPWLASFFAGLRRLVEDAAAPQIVLIERDSADVALWIALSGAALPRASAHRLTFTTYTRRPQQARQQIIGVLPDDGQGLAGYDQRYRVLDCTGPGPGEPTGRQPAVSEDDGWAGIAAQIWLGGAPGLFREASALPGGDFDAGRLAVVALCAGIGLGTGGRTAAADWAGTHPDALDDTELARLTGALSMSGTARPPAESAALARLFATLADRAPITVAAPLGGVVLTDAVRTPTPGLVLPASSALTDDVRQRLATELGPELRAGITDPAQDVPRAVELLHIAGLLGVDCADLLDGTAGRLSHALVADPDGAYTAVVRTVLADRFEFRAVLLGRLEALATDDPPAAARLLARVPLPLTGVRALPHLRMCAEAHASGAAGGDRVGVLHAVIRASGVSLFTDPLVLRTAVQLVWGDGAMTPGEARLLLGETGSDPFRTPGSGSGSGTWSDLVRAALEAPGDDPDAPDLAHDILRCFPEELGPRVRAALLLLEFARDLERGDAGGRWADRAVSLRAVAEPVEPAVLEQAFGAVARRLLSPGRPDGELYALIGAGDTDLIAAYGRAAREETVRDRLRVSPAYVADCYSAWSSRPQAGRAWEEICKSLLEKVLRPVVRALPEADVESVEKHLERAGGRWVREFGEWNRPGAFGRIGRKLSGRGRRPSAEGPRPGDVEPPRKDGRSW